MFERFAKDARTVIVDAQRVAHELGSRAIDTRHLLVTLVERPGPVTDALRRVGADPAAVAAEARAELRSGGLDADALASVGIDLDAVRRQADAVFGPGALERATRSRRGHIPFTTDGKKTLELALREAIRLKHRSIGSRHLALGVLRAECPARTILLRQVDADEFRSALEGEHKAA